MLHRLPRHAEDGVRVSFLPLARKTVVEPGEPLSEAALRAGVPFPTPCFGRGYCGACKVRFVEGAPPPGQWDRLHIPPHDLEGGTRLGCLARPVEDAIVSAPRQGPQIVLDDERLPYRLCPPAQRARVRVSASDLTGALADVLPVAAVGDVPHELTLHTLHDRLRRVELGASAVPSLGLAVHCSGSGLFGWLFDLESGHQVAAGSTSVLGERERPRERAEGVMAAIRRLSHTLCTQSRHRQDAVRTWPCSGSCRSATAGPDTTTSRTAGGCGGLASLACSAAVAVGATEGVSLLISFEPAPWALLLSEERAILCSSDGWRLDPRLFAPAGSPSSIQRVDLAMDVELSPEPVGQPRLSLAGALDAVAELRRVGLLSRQGVISRRPVDGMAASPSLVARVIEDGPGARFVLWGTRDASGTALEQGHVRHVQRLRAVSGLLQQRLMDAAGVYPEQIERVALVGPEAASIRARSAVMLGIVPDLPGVPLEPAPGAFRIAARLALLSCLADSEMIALSERCEEIADPTGGAEWVGRLYLDLVERRPALDARREALIDFRSRGSVGTGRRA